MTTTTTARQRKDETENKDYMKKKMKEREEGLQLLLGGLSLADLRDACWNDEEQQEHPDDYRNDNNTNSIDTRTTLFVEKKKSVVQGACHHHQETTTTTTAEKSNETHPTLTSISTMQPPLFPESDDAAADMPQHQQHAHAFDHAHVLGSRGRIEKPAVRILHQGFVRGNALVATRPILQGQVIFTERAAVASQIPQLPTTATAASTSTSPNDSAVVNFPVRACQYCFRSLEPIHAIRPASSSGSQDPRMPPQPELPRPDLWPVPEFEFDNDDFDYHNNCQNHTNNNAPTTVPNLKRFRRTDKHGRIECLSCHSWFCSGPCRRQFDDELVGTCCDLKQILASLVVCKDHQNETEDNEDEEESDCPDDNNDVQAPVVLAIRMFAASLQAHRTSLSSRRPPPMSHYYLDGLCGTAADLDALELGTPTRQFDPHGDDEMRIIRYSLEHVYQQMKKVWKIAPTEERPQQQVPTATNDYHRRSFDLEYLHQLACIAARNGVGLQTQSPFSTYYAALLRSMAGGRSAGSRQHEAIKSCLAQAIAGDGKVTTLQRGMDAAVNGRVMPVIVALFPLTSRINHCCCQPNAAIQSQQFVDCHLDLVARRDIAAGEEITISYLPLPVVAAETAGAGGGKTTTAASRRRRCLRRQRELQAKYLFWCQCPYCQTDTSDR